MYSAGNMYSGGNNCLTN